MSLILSRSPEELKEDFYKLEDRDDIAALLDITAKQLNFHLYVLDSSVRYTTFYLPKKSGEFREISAPISPIKIIQRKLKQVLEAAYQPKPATQGFVPGRSIVTNARIHKRRRYVLNIDLSDFFPTIHFGRVRGMFMGQPYKLNNEVSTILAQICCHEGALPQGAPTSPIISNMICARLDAKLQQLAKRHQCTYSRYADDITFSTNRSKFPFALARLSNIGQVELGKELLDVILENGFQVNLRKTRLQTRGLRQEVTGLTVNRYPNVQRRYIKKLRGILHAWKKFGIDSTAIRFFDNYAGSKYQAPNQHKPSFEKVVLGKIEFIGMVKGKNSHVYLDLLSKLSKLSPGLVKDSKLASNNTSVTKPFLYTEGKTDRKHIQAALAAFKLKGLFPNLELEFRGSEEPEGYKNLQNRLKFCQEELEKHTRPHIFIFDRDIDKKTAEELKGSEDYHQWNNKVYSFIIPIPKHREELSEMCIELYYKDNDLVRADSDGRRLYLSNEFNPNSGMHLSDLLPLVCKDFQKLKGELKILDNLVVDRNGNPVALSKDKFAENILNMRPGFDKVDFSGFVPLFETISMIISDFDSSEK